ncbi:MAG: hypothetical protein ACYS3N_00215, partial [Planctomycetota bacterium]
KFVSSCGINELYDPSTGRFNQLQRSDILAQVLRLGLVFSLNHKIIDELRPVLLGYQYLGENLNQRGGFLFCRENRNINSWCSMFAIQALSIYNDRSILTKDRNFSLFI